MTATATTFAAVTPDAYVASAEDAAVEAIALDWLMAKDVENEAKKAEAVRKAAGKILKVLLGNKGTVTVNKGGFAKYELTVTPVQGRVSADKALDALVEAGKVSRADADAALEASRGTASERIGLKRLKS